MTLTIELAPDVMDGLSRQAAEKHVTVSTLVESIVSSASEAEAVCDQSSGIDAQELDELVNFGRLRGISGEGFDAIAAQHDGHRL